MKIHPVIHKSYGGVELQKHNNEKNLSISIQHFIHRYISLIGLTYHYNYQFINNRNRFGFMISKSITK